MKNKSVVLCLALNFILSSYSWAAENRSGLWVGTFGKKEVTEGLFFWSEAQLRYSSDLGTIGQTLFRGGVLLAIDESHEMGLLMAYVQTELLKEYRPTFQHVYQKKFSLETLLSLRSRLEYRDLEDNNDSSLRYRLMFRVQRLLFNQTSLIVWDEAFVNLTRENWTGSRFFDRNRFFVGFRWTTESLNLEAGYLNQFIPREQDTFEHLLVVNINY